VPEKVVCGELAGINSLQVPQFLVLLFVIKCAGVSFSDEFLSLPSLSDSTAMTPALCNQLCGKEFYSLHFKIKKKGGYNSPAAK